MTDQKIDPFDVAALEKSLNDSATRVSTVWLSFVAFSAYFAAAISNVSHRQIFLEEPIKLPTVNIDLPLAASACLLPLLFVIFHVYVLLQVVLLARTADTYNEAIGRVIPFEGDNARVRQRLANTLFAQLFAGSPRERRGVVGWLLRLIAWVTLAIAPVFVLVVFQLKFLPYHNSAVTWTHRGMIAIDLLAVLCLWAGAVEPSADIQLATLWRRGKSATAAAVVLMLSCLLMTFPGEANRAWMPYFHSASDEVVLIPLCRLPAFATRLHLTGADRIVLPNEDFVDYVKLGRIEKAALDQGRHPSEGERTRDFHGRNLSCADLTNSDLSRATFFKAYMPGAQLSGAKLQGAALNHAVLTAASLHGAQLEGSSFEGSDLSDAKLTSTNLRNARFIHANMVKADLSSSDLRAARLEHVDLREARFSTTRFQEAKLENARLDKAYVAAADFQNAELKDIKFDGASLVLARFQGAKIGNTSFNGAFLDQAGFQGASILASVNLQAASFRDAAFQGAWLPYAHLEGANLTGVGFQGAVLSNTFLQGATLDRANLNGALLLEAKLEGASFVGASAWRTVFSAVSVSRAGPIDCNMARVSGTLPRPSDTSAVTSSGDPAAQLLNQWRDCEKKAAEFEAANPGKFDAEHASALASVICLDSVSGMAIANGIMQHFVMAAPNRGDLVASIARGVLGRNEKDCPARKSFDSSTLGRLQSLQAAAPATPTVH